MKQHGFLKKALITAITVIAVTVMLALTASAAQTGTCGESLTWSYENGILSVSGTGEMSDYTPESPAPWNDVKANILEVRIGADVTGIGNFAFKSC